MQKFLDAVVIDPLRGPLPCTNPRNGREQELVATPVSLQALCDTPTSRQGAGFIHEKASALASLVFLPVASLGTPAHPPLPALCRGPAAK